ncbi:hypothetical protein PHLCEN_2v5242 [Hermanssonia centrifuga]|uniref:Uncharacterized protein n=1 Tax=Hermanssonia centrifuga TaxID=98765 RepID=A0A2R6P8T2_9APHY|nr:hypothetical protein PHLCEN_2v5242 [Hermanssonia centrifuga]
MDVDNTPWGRHKSYIHIVRWNEVAGTITLEVRYHRTSAKTRVVDAVRLKVVL